MASYEIPLSPYPQQFYIALAGVQYSLTVSWNSVMECYVTDIDGQDGVSLLKSIPLVPGVDLLSQYKHLGIGGSLYVQSDGDPNAVPAYDQLGVTGHLYFVTP